MESSFPSRELFDHDKTEGIEMKINKTFASKYEARKDKEELTRLRTKLSKKDKFSKDDDSTEGSDEEEEEEDSDAELITYEVGAKILTTISKIQMKKKEIYDKDHTFFDDHDFEHLEKKEKLNQPLTFTKFISSTLKKEGADAFAKDEEEHEKTAPTASNYENEQKALKKAFLDAADEQLDYNNESEDLFQVRSKTAEDQREEELSFQEFLKKRAIARAEDESQLLERYFQANEVLEPSEAFLRDYIMYEGWKEGRKMPQGNLSLDSCGNELFNEDEDEKNLDETDKFEAAYNFRFEEGATPKIEGHARQVYDSVRLRDDKRRRQRIERHLRKQEEKENKRKEVERLKKLKRKEFVERLKIIQRIAGVKCDIDELNVDFDKEFDEKEHEKQMHAILGNNFDNEEEHEDVKDLLETPEEIEQIKISKAPMDTMSEKQKKKIAKLAKKQAKLNRNIHRDTEEAYAPIEEDEEENYQDGENGDWNVLEGEDDNENQNSNKDLPQNDSNLTYLNEGEALWFLCDGCCLPIPAGAKRYDCLTCDNFCLCTKCFRSIRHPHQLTRKRVPQFCKPPEKCFIGSSSNLSYAHRELNLPDTVEESTMTSEQKAMINEMIDEYYSLDFEDIIGGDLPVRFKYAKVAPNDYGLTIDDILSKPDKELNAHISLKKLAPYRQNDRSKFHNGRQKSRGDHQSSQIKTLKSNYYKSETSRDKHGYNNNQAEDTKKRKSKNDTMEMYNKPIPEGIDGDRLKAYGLSLPSHKKKKKVH